LCQLSGKADPQGKEATMLMTRMLFLGSLAGLAACGNSTGPNESRTALPPGESGPAWHWQPVELCGTKPIAAPNCAATIGRQ